MIGGRLLAARLTELSSELDAAGVPFALATVVYRRAPVSSHLGDKAIVAGDGRLFGWIGGSCSQSIVRREALSVIATGQPKLLRLTLDAQELAEARDSVTTVPMACPSGGEVSIYIEPHVCAPQVVAIGDTPIVQAVARMAPVLGFDVMVVGAGEPAADDERVRVAAADELAALELGPTSFVIVAAAGQYDEEALAAALRSPARYVCLVASRRRARTVMETLVAGGFAPEQIQRIHSPAGLDIGAVSQEEIALSILAQIVQEYRASQRELASRAQEVQLPGSGVARDPVCGMDVEIEGARHVAEYGGSVYYFCCPHCRKSFLEEPERYLSA